MKLTLPANDESPLYQRLYLTLRQAILDGSISAGTRLPASRQMCLDMELSRNTVVTAYDMLKAEGFVESRQGSGLFVASELPVSFTNIPTRQPAAAVSLSQRGAELAKHSRPVPTIDNPAFVPGLPDINAFPFSQWHKCVQQHSRLPSKSLMKYQDQGGLPALKHALRHYLKLSRGVNCLEQQIIIVNGSQAGLDLIMRLLVDIEETVAVEDPGYLGARDGFLAAGAQLLEIPVDESGMNIDVLENTLNHTHNIKLVYTTPSNQFPLSVSLSLPRRLQLLALARQHNFFILEDDYDSEFRYHEKPLSSLQGLDSEQRVIYMGTFSKVMFPGLRLGYLVVPENLAQAFAFALRKTGQDSPLLLQAIMASFMENGYFQTHLRNMRKLYGEKQQRFVTAATQHLSDWLEFRDSNAGMQLAGVFKSGLFKTDSDEQALVKAARQEQLNITLLSRYSFDERPLRGLYLGYAGIELRAIEPAVIQLAGIFKASSTLHTQS